MNDLFNNRKKTKMRDPSKLISFREVEKDERCSYCSHLSWYHSFGMCEVCLLGSRDRVPNHEFMTKTGRIKTPEPIS